MEQNGVFLILRDWWPNTVTQVYALFKFLTPSCHGLLLTRPPGSPKTPTADMDCDCEFTVTVSY